MTHDPEPYSQSLQGPGLPGHRLDSSPRALTRSSSRPGPTARTLVCVLPLLRVLSLTANVLMPAPSQPRVEAARLQGLAAAARCPAAAPGRAAPPMLLPLQLALESAPASPTLNAEPWIVQWRPHPTAVPFPARPAGRPPSRRPGSTSPRLPCPAHQQCGSASSRARLSVVQLASWPPWASAPAACFQRTRGRLRVGAPRQRRWGRPGW